jgi:hypothetical protein
MAKDYSKNRAAVRLTEDEKYEFDKKLAESKTTQQDILYRAVREFLGDPYLKSVDKPKVSLDILRAIRRSAEQIIDAIAIAEQRISGDKDTAAHGPTGRGPVGGVAGNTKGVGRTRKLTAAS